MTFAELCDKLSKAESLEEYRRLQDENDYWPQYYKLKAALPKPTIGETASCYAMVAVILPLAVLAAGPLWIYGKATGKDWA